jgi:hypothetical protein
MVVLNLSIRYMPPPLSLSLHVLDSHKYLLNCVAIVSNYARMYVSKVICATLVRPEFRATQMCLLFLS